jgi:hypothetical protein
MPGLPRTSVPDVTPPLADAPAEDAHPERRREDVLGTNRGADPAADEDAGAGDEGLGVLPAGSVVGVPSFFIDSFGVPPFLLPIYQAAGIEYGVPWQLLAAINAVETDYGRNLRVSSAGAVGWMQFLPSTFAQYGVDGNGDGSADPYSPVDAIFSAANYLRAAGAGEDLGAAVFAYNHSPAYVADVLSRARLLGGLPADLVSALSGLAQGRPPVLGSTAVKRGSTTTLRLRTTTPGAALVAVTDGLVERIGHSRRLGRYLRLRDVYGNTYTYGRLANTARRYPVLTVRARPAQTRRAERDRPAPPRQTGLLPALASTDWAAQAARTSPPGAARAPAGSRSAYDRRLLGGVAARDVRDRPLREGSRVIAGTVLAHASRAGSASWELAFEIRPAGSDAPRIRPAPVVEGWQLAQDSARSTTTRAAAQAPPGIGRVLLLGKNELQRAVLADDHIEIGRCGRRDIRAGRVDRRVLAALKYLTMSGLDPTLGPLKCSDATRAGIDIVAVNGVPVAGHQGPGSIADATIRRLLTLQGTLRPREIASLFAIEGASNTRAEPGLTDRIHVGYAVDGADNSLEARNSDGVLPASAWRRLSRRLGRIANPVVSPRAGRP